MWLTGFPLPVAGDTRKEFSGALRFTCSLKMTSLPVGMDELKHGKEGIRSVGEGPVAKHNL
jgi:hypothetical protein